MILKGDYIYLLSRAIQLNSLNQQWFLTSSGPNNPNLFYGLRCINFLSNKSIYLINEISRILWPAIRNGIRLDLYLFRDDWISDFFSCFAYIWSLKINKSKCLLSQTYIRKLLLLLQNNQMLPRDSIYTLPQALIMIN